MITKKTGIESIPKIRPELTEQESADFWAALHPERITNHEQLYALPDGAVVVDSEGVARQSRSARNLFTKLPALVVWVPLPSDEVVA